MKSLFLHSFPTVYLKLPSIIGSLAALGGVGGFFLKKTNNTMQTIVNMKF